MLDSLGPIIKFHRKKSGLTQDELAKLAGIGKAAVFDIAKTKRPTQCQKLPV